jgi:hypothetical protein
MDSALASLLGAVVGGGIAASSNLGVEAFRSRRSTKADKARDQRETRRASRLLTQELEAGRSLIEESVARDYFIWEPPERELPAAAWNEHRATLAEQGSDEDWEALAAAYAEFDRLNWHVRGVLAEEDYMTKQMRGPFAGLEIGPAAKLDDALTRIDAGMDALKHMEQDGS